MIRVYRLPEKLTNGFCFNGGNPISFLNVDWFDDNGPFGVPTREQIEEEVRRKKYYSTRASFLILRDTDAFVMAPSPHQEGTEPK